MIVPLATLPQVQLHVLDLLVLGGYFFFVFGLGWWVYRRTKTGDDLFLAGRTLGWSVIGFSLFASNISSTTLVGLMGSAYTTGISVANYEWMAAFILVFMVFFSIPFFLRSKIRTIPEYLERRFSRRSRIYFSGLNIFLIVFVDTAAGLYAGALVLQLFFPAFTLWQLCLIIALVAGLYTAGGGLKAVAYTDVAQAIILLIGSCAITYAILDRLDFAWFASLGQLPPEQISLIRPLDDPSLPWAGTLIGVPILGFYFWSSNQFITQRILGARDIEHARWGALFAGFLKVIPLFIMIIPGALALLVFPNIENGDLVFPTLMIELLPPGVLGLVLAALVAAVMSSVDSSLNSASTLITLDFVDRPGKRLSQAQTVKLGRIITITLMTISAIWAPMIEDFPGLWFYLQAVLAYAVPPVAVIFLLGMLWRRGTSQAAFAALWVTHICAGILFFLVMSETVSLHFTYVAGILFGIGAVVFIIVSLLTPAPNRESLKDLCWSPDMRLAGDSDVKRSWWSDYRWQSAALIIFTSAVVILFW